MIARDPWDARLADIHSQCRAVGWWSGEVRLLRDALGARRMGPRVVARITERLATAGYEIDGEIRFESDMALVVPAGPRALAGSLEAMLQDVRALDAAIPSRLEWRDALIARGAAGRYLERTRTAHIGESATPAGQ